MAFRSKPRAIGQGEVTTINPNGGRTTQYTTIYERVPVMSTGVSLRVNVFGYFVIEPYVALPFQRTDVSGPVFGMAFAPGW